MKKRITRKRLYSFIEDVANINEWEHSPGETSKVYESKLDGSYISHVGMKKEFKFFLKRGITEQLQSVPGGRTTCLGFNPEEQKWYGWSHRAVFGFGIGSVTKRGNCGFFPSNKEEFMESYKDFWVDEEYIAAAYTKDVAENGVPGVRLTRIYNYKVPNELLRGTVREDFEPYPSVWGRGEWTACSLADAKEMAIDFARGVS